MSALITVELVVGVLLGLVIGALLYVWIRRRWISSGHALVICAIRTTRRPRWRLGLMRIGDDRLAWFSVVGPSPFPEASWARHDLDLGVPLPLTDAIPGLTDPVRVAGTGAGEPVELALSPSDYMAVRAWLESSPPGFNVNIA